MGRHSKAGKDLDAAVPLRGKHQAIPDLLAIWLSPSFPVGAFAFSHGLEKLLDRGAIGDGAALKAWLCDLLRHGSAAIDLIILAEAWRATISGSCEEVSEINDLAIALQPSAERHLETTTQGASFAAAVLAGWPDAASPGLSLRPLAYPAAVAIAAATYRLPLKPTLRAYALAFVSNLVSVAIRLGIFGQFEALAVISRLHEECTVAAARASRQTLADLGACMIETDIASMLHETQYTRIFRS